MSKNLKTRKGITLVSLVITIIVLLILAGITINLTIGDDGIIRRAQEAGKNYIDVAENEKVQLGQFTNEMDNIIGGSTNNGRVQYNSEFRKNVVEAINEAGVATSETDADETIVKNIGKILQEKTKDATATADNISEGKTAWVNGELITGNGSDNEAYLERGIKYWTFTISCAKGENTCSIAPYCEKWNELSKENGYMWLFRQDRCYINGLDTYQELTMTYDKSTGKCTFVRTMNIAANIQGLIIYDPAKDTRLK